MKDKEQFNSTEDRQQIIVALIILSSIVYFALGTVCAFGKRSLIWNNPVGLMYNYNL